MAIYQKQVRPSETIKRVTFLRDLGFWNHSRLFFETEHVMVD